MAVPATRLRVDSRRMKGHIAGTMFDSLEGIESKGRIEQPELEAGSYERQHTYAEVDLTVTEEEALITSSTPEDLKLGLRGVTRRSGAASLDDDFGSPRRGGKSSNRGGIQRGFEF